LCEPYTVTLVGIRVKSKIGVWILFSKRFPNQI
jgi:hypothetical protein